MENILYKKPQRNSKNKPPSHSNLINTFSNRLSPVGVLFLVSAKVLEVDDLAEIVKKLGFYFLTVCGGILFHGFVVLPVIFFLMTKKNPITYIGNMGQALATAFGTSSSSATLPITIKCLEDNNHIDKRVTRFVIPIGSTINMDGTALYEAVAAIFIAQIRGISLSFGNIVAIWFVLKLKEKIKRYL